jgi:hypothetical protein
MDLQDYAKFDAEILEIYYPMLHNLQKINSVSFDKQPVIEGELIGIKGQYLLFEGGMVTNIRSASGYLIELNY